MSKLPHVPQKAAVVLAIVSAVALAAALPFAATLKRSDAAPPLAESDVASFSPPIYVDETRLAGEPGIKVDDEGRIFAHAPCGLLSCNQGWLWRSVDGGVTWEFIDFLDTGKRLSPAIGGGDSDVAITPGGRIYYADLWLGDISVSRSDDGGHTWIYGTPVASNVPLNDRQWLGTYGENTVYVVYNQIPYGPMVTKSVDGGLTWQTMPAVPLEHGLDSWTMGNMVVDPHSGHIHFVYTHCGEVCGSDVYVARSTDGGETWTQHLVHAGKGNSGNVFASLARDLSGNLYATWSEQNRTTGAAHVYVSASMSGGDEWTAPVLVSEGLGNGLMPWIVAGSEGRVGIAFYGTDYDGDAASAPPETEWRVYYAFSRDAHEPALSSDAKARAPRFVLGPAISEPNHLGSICNEGLNCDLTGGDRSLLDFFQVTVDPQGRANIIYSDNRENPGRDPFVAFTRQATGHSLYEPPGPRPERIGPES